MSAERLPRGAVLRCLGAAALFGAAAPAAKAVLGALGPLTLAGVLYLGAALAVAPAAWAGRAHLRRPRGARLARLLGALVAGGVVAPALLMLALRQAEAASVSLALSLETVFTGALAALFFHEHLGPRGWAANALVFLAGVLLALSPGGGLALQPGLLLAALACLGWALDNNLSSVITELTPAQLTLAKGLFAGAFNTALGLALEGAPSMRAVAAGLAVGALGYGLSLVLYIRGARDLGAARAQMFFATGPVFGAALAWWALGEHLQPTQLLALVVLGAGLALLFTERHGHLHRHEAMRHTHAHRHDDGHHDHAHPGLPPEVEHTHEHVHAPGEHAHPHAPDLHHRHEH